MEETTQLPWEGADLSVQASANRGSTRVQPGFLTAIQVADAIKERHATVTNCDLKMTIEGAKVLQKTDLSSVSETVLILGDMIYSIDSTKHSIAAAFKISFYTDPKIDNSLQVENAVYMGVVNDIIKNRFSPNLVTGITNFSCDGFLQLVSRGQHTNPTYSQRLMYEEILKSMRGINADVFDLSRATVLVLERVNGPGLKQFIENLLTTMRNSGESASGVGVLVKIILMVLFTVRIFEVMGIRHNDLHLDNIKIKYLQKTEQGSEYFIYFLTNVVYFAIPVTYLPIIYDFDLSATTQVINTKLDSYNFCTNYGICNEANSKFDSFTFLRLLYQEVAHVPEFQSVQQFIEVCISPKLRTATFGFPARLCNLTTDTKGTYHERVEEWEHRREEKIERLLDRDPDLTEEEAEEIAEDEMPPKPASPVEGTAALTLSDTVCNGNWVPVDGLLKSISEILMLPIFSVFRHELPEFDAAFVPRIREDLTGVHSRIWTLPTVDREKLFTDLQRSVHIEF
jgi:hypothetical protein